MNFRYSNGDQPLAGFTIKRGLGVGGFGEVYFAINDAGKEVALKQIQRNLEVEVRGVRQCMNLKHPNLIALFDVKYDEQGQGWIVMEYVSGPSLKDIIDVHSQGLPSSELLRWFGQIASGVAYLHDHGIVHRDLKPANIFEDEGMVKIGDYGLSKFISCSRRGGQTESVGTFHYMAPEIGKGEYGKEVDIYALGVLLYELATGTVPFDGESSQEIIMKHLTANPDLTAVPSPLREVISRALAKNPASRFRDVREMLRPLGMDIDDRGLLISTAAVALPPLPQASFEPPVMPLGAVGRAHQGGPVGPAAAVAFAAMSPPEPQVHATRLQYQEPIARVVQSWIQRFNQWYTHELSASTRTIVLILAILAAVMHLGVIIPLLVLALMVYVPYYAIWWLFIVPRGPAGGAERAGGPAAHQGQALAMPRPVQPVAPRRPVQAPKPMSPRQWRLAKRSQLARLSRAGLWSQITGSWLTAAAVVSVFSLLASLFMLSDQRPWQPMMAAVVWTALVSLTAAFAAIALGKHWQCSEGDWPMRSFVQLTSGFAVGLVAYLLADYLMVWPMLAESPPSQNWLNVVAGRVPAIDLGGPASPAGRWMAFSDGQNLLLPAYLAYFPLLMGLVGWWKQVDPLRRARFSIWAVVWSMLMASLLQWLVPFPQPWCALLAGGTSVAIQLASPWINPDERWMATAGGQPSATC